MIITLMTLGCGGIGIFMAGMSLISFGIFLNRPSDAPAHALASSHVGAAAGGTAVLDGDTVRVGDQVVRLEGIDAPARGSVCRGGAQRRTGGGLRHGGGECAGVAAAWQPRRLHDQGP